MSKYQVILTHLGHRRLLARQHAQVAFDEDENILARVAEHGVLNIEGSAQIDRMITHSWMSQTKPGLTPKDALLRYLRNPLENLERINFEMTTQCNFTCLHCRNGDGVFTREKDITKLESAGRLFLSIGVRRFDFIGGEVSRYGKGWLELAQSIQANDCSLDWPSPLIITLYTNGWWLGEKDFKAAGKKYEDEAAYLADMKAHGVTHILFSIDGPPERHDEWRKHPGLFNRIVDGIARIKSAGLAPRLSLIIQGKESLKYLKPLLDVIYDDTTDPFQEFSKDKMNHVSNFIDSGYAAENLREGKYDLSTVTPSMVRCKAFFRPHPTMRITANGSLGICPLMLGEEEYGNIHEKSLIDIINRIDEAPLFRLHATGQIGKYLKDVDPEKFSSGFDHPCAVIVEVNRVALADLSSTSNPDRKAST